MFISLLTLLLISNALTLRSDKSILFSRVVMVSLVHTSFLAYNNLFFLVLDKGIWILGGLFLLTVFTQMFNIFIFILTVLILALTVLILTLTSFYPRKVFLNKFAALRLTLISNALILNSYKYIFSRVDMVSLTVLLSLANIFHNFKYYKCR